MNNQEFTDLIARRKKLADNFRENQDDIRFFEILAKLYSDPSHFIYEILQNAEDAKATWVSFELKSNGLIVYHDGRDFDFTDIKKITGVGSSNKKDDLTQIGKFGIGFKSVFAITRTPYIFSGGYSIVIKDYIVPEPVDSVEKIIKTCIELPFNSDLNKPNQVYKLTYNRLSNLGAETLLFLKSIKEVRWKTADNEGYYSKNSEIINEIAKKVILNSDKDSPLDYLVISDSVKIGKQYSSIEVAYKIGTDKNNKKIITPHQSKLFVFFPTEKETFLDFIIQGHYKTTPNRENIPIKDSQNLIILKATGDLVGKSIPIVKNTGLLDFNFFDILPVNSEADNGPIYEEVYKNVKRKLLSGEKLLPTLNGEYTDSNSAIIADCEEITRLLDTNDLKEMYGKKDWLDLNITRKEKLRNYFLNDLKIPEINLDNFLPKLSKEFLQRKSDEWLINLYKYF